MTKFSECLITLLTISHFTVYSVPIRHIEKQQPVKVARRETSENADDNLQENEFAHELANAALPNYLKDLYMKFTFPAHAIQDQKNAKANTIRSYENQINDAGCGYYKFDIDKASINGEEIIDAELRLLQKISMPGDYYEVNINLLNNKNIDSPQKLTFKYMDSSPGWKAFNITPIVESWKQGWVNYGLKVTLTKGGQQLSCEGVYSSGEQEDMLNTEPLLVVFSHDSTNKFLSKVFMDKKITDTKHQKEKHQATRSVDSLETSHVSCHLQKMEVSNTAISADNVHLVIPKLFDVGVCVGHCPRLPVESLTDYASILSLHYHQTRGHVGAPKRCCVPSNFELIQMVFYDELTHEHIFKTVPARATSCGCV